MRQRSRDAMIRRAMAEPDMVVHLLVPHAGGQGHLAVHAAGRPRLPTIGPALERGDTVVTAVQRILRDSWGLEAVVLETHLPPPPDGDGYVALAVLEPPPVGWTPPDALSWADAVGDLPERIAPRARTWLAEWAEMGEPPALRPRWSRPGWLRRVTRWTHASLAENGLRADGPLQMRRLWAISALVCSPHDGGHAAWFKAVFPHFHHEPAVTALLETSVPGLVPSVLATDVDEGWLLLEEAGEPLPDGESDDADDVVLAAIGQLVDAQEATRNRLDEFAALGCPRRPLSTLPDELTVAMSDAVALGGEEVAPDRLRRVVAFVGDQAAWLDGLGMGDVLVHGDFHPGNLLVGTGGTRIIDWSDAAISHPAVEIGPWLGEVRPELRSAGWEAWIAALARFGPADELRHRHREAYAVACAYQVVSYAGILRGIEPANRYQLRDGFVGYWKALEASVPR
jgi:aminoglycoside/choline kinase family phosphotransferase